MNTDVNWNTCTKCQEFFDFSETFDLCFNCCGGQKQWKKHLYHSSTINKRKDCEFCRQWLKLNRN